MRYCSGKWDVMRKLVSWLHTIEIWLEAHNLFLPTIWIKSSLTVVVSVSVVFSCMLPLTQATCDLWTRHKSGDRQHPETDVCCLGRLKGASAVKRWLRFSSFRFLFSFRKHWQPLVSHWHFKSRGDTWRRRCECQQQHLQLNPSPSVHEIFIHNS